HSFSLFLRTHPSPTSFSTISLHDALPICRGRVIVTVTDARGDTVMVDSSGPGKQGVNRYVWALRYAGPVRLSFERPAGAEEEENPFRSVVGPRAVPGSYSVAVTAGGRTETTAVRVEPDPVLGGDPGRFAA